MLIRKEKQGGKNMDRYNLEQKIWKIDEKMPGIVSNLKTRDNSLRTRDNSELTFLDRSKVTGVAYTETSHYRIAAAKWFHETCTFYEPYMGNGNTEWTGWTELYWSPKESKELHRVNGIEVLTRQRYNNGGRGDLRSYNGVKIEIDSPDIVTVAWMNKEGHGKILERYNLEFRFKFPY
jgi:hypothetical protein